MTIDDLADFITRKMQKTDAVSVQFCKDAIRGRWQILWDARLWRRSLVIDTVDVPAGTNLVTMPATIDRVVALRYGPRITLDAANWESLLKDDPTFYERLGLPWSFIQAGRDDEGNVLIRLTATNNADETMLIVGKMPFPKCAADSDSPSDYLDGVDRTLIAFGEGDMLERQQQWQAAQLKFTEATALMKTMEGLQNDQSGQSFVISPSPNHYHSTIW